MLETYSPRPLLSDVVRNFHGTYASTIEPQEDIVLSTTRQFLRQDDRVPLKLASRKIPTSDDQGQQKYDDNANENETSSSGGPTERFTSLLAERERKKITLDPRTIPLELPPYQPMQLETSESEAFKKKEEEKLLKKYQEEERKRRILESAFASDEEVESSSDSEWEIGEAVYSSESDEE